VPPESYVALPGGIVGYRSASSTVLVWFCREGEKPLSVAAVSFLPVDHPLGTNDLRNVPLGRIKAFANGHRDRILGDIEKKLTMEEAAAMVTREPPTRARRPNLKLPVSEGSNRHPDAFYRRLAKLYVDLATVTKKPAADIAEANDVPVTTVHRWIRETRRRGFLPPGSAGTVG
jgi:hypothetical protein